MNNTSKTKDNSLRQKDICSLVCILASQSPNSGFSCNFYSHFLNYKLVIFWSNVSKLAEAGSVL